MIRNIGYICFFLSGTAALVYEVLWLKLLGLVFGNTTYAISVVLSAYMAGLGIGSYVSGRYAHHFRNPLRTYGVLELIIGLYCAFTFQLVDGMQWIYVYFAQVASPSAHVFTAVRLLLTLPVLFVPTFMMGATMPVLSRMYIRTTRGIGSGTAALYTINTAGAVCGTLAAGFVLIPVLGKTGTLAVTVALNLIVAAIAIMAPAPALDSNAPPDNADAERPARPQSGPSASVRWLPAGIFVSGIAAMLLEVSWTRILAAVLGSSSYAFTIMLSTFLFGLAAGSALCKRALSLGSARGSHWAWLQIGIAASAMVALPLYEYMDLATLRVFSLTLGYPNLFNLFRAFLCSGLMIGPTLCFGATFPISVALYTRKPQDIGRGIGSLYLANTAGNIVGSLAAGFVMIPLFGIHRTAVAAIVISAAIGIAAMPFTARGPVRRGLAPVAAAACIVIGLFHMRNGWDPRNLTRGLHVLPHGSLDKSTVDILAANFDRQVLFYREGMNAVVSVSQVGEHRNLKVNAKADASTVIDLHTQLFCGSLPHLLHPAPRRSLVIGFGSGSTLAASLAFPVEQVDLVEIEPAVLEAAPYFDRINRRAYEDPRVRMIVGDGRNHLLVEPNNYDIIISEPSNPWMAGTATLFTVDFYEHVRNRLNAGGILCQWVQSYSLAPSDFRMVIASVRHIFPQTTLWNCQGGDWLIIASESPVVVDHNRIEQCYNTLPLLRQDLDVLNIRGAAGILSYFMLGNNDLGRFVGHDTRLNTDNHLHLEFNAPKTLHVRDTSTLIADLIATYRTVEFPPIVNGPDILKVPRALNHLAEGLLGRNRNTVSPRIIDYFNRSLKLIALGEHHADANTGLGRCFLYNKNAAGALQPLRTATQQDPKSAEAWAYLGVAYQQTGNSDQALAALRRATELDASEAEYFLWLGQVLESRQQYTDAATAFARSTANNPYSLKAHIARSRSHRLAGDVQSAILELEQLRNVYDSYAAIYVELRAAYIAADRGLDAVELYEKLVAVNPYKKQYWIELILLYDAYAPESKRATEALRRGRTTTRFFEDELYLARQAALQQASPAHH